VRKKNFFLVIDNDNNNSSSLSSSLSVFLILVSRYLELVEAILVRGDWSGSCDCYRRETLQRVLEEIRENDGGNEQSRWLAEELLENHLSMTSE
jgi:hypothetical protein